MAVSQSNRPMIDLADVRLALDGAAGRVEILRGLDLSVRSGESLAVVGPSGAGKSTMMMVIAGLERADSGRVDIAGNDLTGLSEDELALFRRQHVGIVFQGFHLVPTMTALENVAVPLEFAGRRDAFDRARESLERVGLGHRTGHYPGQLSGGEQQRVAIARAFAPDCDILLADEPTGNLDTETGEKIVDLLFGLQQEDNRTLVLITHDENLARRCGRVARLADGRIVDDGAGAVASAAS